MAENQQRKILREEDILLSLKRLDYLARNQIQRLHDLGGDRNARRILSSMSPLISSFRSETGENVYYLSKAGRERIGCEVIRQKSNQVGHYLMRNDAFIYFAKNEDWKNETKFSVEGVVSVIPDAYFRYNQRRHFLEIDHLQHMNKNREKIDRYRKLHETGVFQQKLKYFPQLVWVTLVESRKKQLLEWCAGLDVVVYVWNEIK